jgi:hypothetical protein
LANSGQRCRWFCAGGAYGGLLSAVLYRPLGLELASMNPIDNDDDDDTQVYKRQWVGLTDEEILQGNKESWVTLQAWQSAVWWAEAKLREKNS